jgi:hypothetical protein
MGERGNEGLCPCPPPAFLKESGAKNFEKGVFYIVSKSFWESKTLFSKRVLAGQGQSPCAFPIESIFNYIYIQKFLGIPKDLFSKRSFGGVWGRAPKSLSPLPYALKKASKAR